MSIINKTVDEVLYTFNKAIKDLEQIQDSCQKRADKKAEIIAKAQAEKDEALLEKNRATKVARKIADLVS